MNRGPRARLNQGDGAAIGVNHPEEPCVYVLEGALARHQLAALCNEIEEVLRAVGPDDIVCDLGGVRTPDAVTLEALARFRLAARDHDKTCHFVHACPELVDLAGLVGLDEILGLRCPGSDAQGHSEQRE